MKTLLELLYEGLKCETDVAALVSAAREEDLNLEFKEKQDSRDGKLVDDDKKNFSKSVSGFANAAGGVLIFGVQTKSNPDRAGALKPITDSLTFVARLRDSVIKTTQPPVDGVRVEGIQSPSGGGYVKCFIPASDLLPHRAMLAAYPA